MKYQDYYTTLGVTREASQDDIKRAYRKLARKYHPDVSKEADAEQKFKALGEAYEVLKDPEKRAAYDQLGSNWQSGQDFQAPPDWNAGFEFSGGGFTADHNAYSDFFESLFGRGFQRDAHASHRPFGGHGEDHHAKVMIALEDSLHGATRAITLHEPVVDALGHVRTRDRTLNIKIPKGIRPGQSIRLTGQGEPGLSGAPAGDLYLEVAFKDHPIYRVEGADIYLDLPVAPWEAALGANIRVPAPGKTVDMKIPSNSAAGKTLRLKGAGLPGKQAGDFYVVLKIALPPANSEIAKQRYQEMARDLAFNPRAELGV